MLKLKQRGDTIVEVMIALAILGSAISIAYVTASRSLTNTRQAQEAAVGTTIAQTQLEQLRSKASTSIPTDDIYQAAGTKFCIDINGTNRVTTDLTKCEFTFDDNGAVYNVVILHEETQNNKFTIKVTWPNVSGDGDDSATLIYRVHKTP